MEYVGREKAEFNDALGYLMRINSLFYIADASSMELNAYRWFHALSVLYRELSTKMKPEELTKIDNIRQQAASLVNNHVRNPKNLIGGGMQPALYQILDRLELELRKVYKDSGLEMKFAEDPHFALQA